MPTKKQHDINCGLDGEFILINPESNRIVQLSKYLPRDGEFGLDDHGNQCTAEIRSPVSVNPVEVAEGIKVILQNGLENNFDFYDFKWVAGSFVKNLPIGAHLHFSHAFDLADPVKRSARFLDDYVGSISLLLENRSQGIKRRAYSETPMGNHVSYGKPSDIRFIPNKEVSHWEYRTCSSFLVSEEICRAFLCLGKVVLFEVLNNPEIRYKKYVTHDDFVYMNVNRIRKIFPKIWLDISKMILFKKFRKHLDIIPQMVDRGLSWDKGLFDDMKEGWGLNLNRVNRVNREQKYSFREFYINPDKVATAAINQIKYDNLIKDLAIKHETAGKESYKEKALEKKEKVLERGIVATKKKKDNKKIWNIKDNGETFGSFYKWDFLDLEDCKEK
jgi:hypothetical protein